MKINLRRARLAVLLLLVAVVAGGAGFLWGSRVEATPAPVWDHQQDLSLFWDVWDRLEKAYINKETLNAQKMIYGSIEGLVASLGDPYTVFLTPQNNDEIKQRLNGSFEGVGMELGYREGFLAVIAPLPDTPAQKAGIRAGDLILKIEDQETTNVSLPEAVRLIRGPKGTAVKLTLLHQEEAEPYEVSVVRDKIVVPSVKLSFEDDVAHLQLLTFGDRTKQEWLAAVNRILAKQPKGVILDLRNNTGGYLDGAVFVASEFLADGVVVQQEFSDGHKENLVVDHQGRLLGLPLVVLINQGSASASEIVAGALRDYDRATLVGETSFGKGSVQEAQDLANGAGLHVTTARWLLPKGDSIDQQGIDPDVKIKDDLTTESDEQLEKAREYLNA